MINNNEMFLLKLGEVVLKGLNRRSFEDRLLSNTRRRMKACGNFNIYLRQSTIYVEPKDDECDLEAAYAACQQVFGVVAVARAVPCEKSVEAIVSTAKEYLAGEFAQAKTFKVESKRADKHFYLNSIQISQAVGGELAEAFPNVSVDVHKPALTVYGEIREKFSYVHAPSVPGAGGLPIGTGGHAVSLLSGGLDSPVSSWMIARRGVELEMVHFVSPPYTSQQAQDKVVELARLLTASCGRMIVHIIPFTEIQEEIRKNCPEEFFTLIMRRFMMRLAEAVAKKAGAKALVTGESLGQVASQTMLSLGVTEAVTTMPVLRPLIGMDKVEIIRLARRIGTYDTSILPSEDCCTVFTPRHPCTRPVLADIEAAEAALDVEGLVQKALEGETWVRVKP
ncbi:MAG: tRNA 4-thiouridine(8) synthase ThiI [Oscillibacter sp.]|nr:tRNA 4-thiouridine(8) synthase ThiI [Oscillibacter sp.]